MENSVDNASTNTLVDPISRYNLRVRGYHLDGYQHVNHARYLEFLEEGRWKLVDDNPSLGVLLVKQGLAMVAVNLNIDYHRAAVVNDDLVVETFISRIGSKSADISHRILIRDTGDLVAKAKLVFVLLDPKSNKAVAMTGECEDVMKPLLVTETA